MNCKNWIRLTGLFLTLLSGGYSAKSQSGNPSPPITREEAERVLVKARKYDAVLEQNTVLEAQVANRERKIQALQDTISIRDRMITHLKEDNRSLRQELSDTGNELQSERGLKRAYMWGLIVVFAGTVAGVLGKVFGWFKFL